MKTRVLNISLVLIASAFAAKAQLTPVPVTTVTPPTTQTVVPSPTVTPTTTIPSAANRQPPPPAVVPAPPAYPSGTQPTQPPAVNNLNPPNGGAPPAIRRDTMRNPGNK